MPPRYKGAPMVVKAYTLYRTSHRGGSPVKLDATGRLAAHEFETESLVSRIIKSVDEFG